MQVLALRHEIDCSVDRFWEVFFDRAYNEELYRQELGFPKFEILEQRETETGLLRKAAGTPKMNAPAAVQKLLGSNFGYVETGTFDKAKKEYRWALQMSTLPDKLRTEGWVRTEPLGESRCRRLVEITIEAKVFGVGGLLESTAEKGLRDGWEKSAAFLNRYLSRK